MEHSRKRLDLFGLKSELWVADAESLSFAHESFDLVYSWGVRHDSPNTACAIDETWRVLRHGGRGKIMIYHKHSLVGYMIWLCYGLLSGKPWRSLSDVYAHHLESPGTKACRVDEARTLFRKFAEVRISTALTHGDLLESAVGQRHRGWLLSMARRSWPRRFLRWALPGHGLFMLIDARK